MKNVTEFVNSLKKDIDSFHTYYTEQIALNDKPVDLSEDEWFQALTDWDQLRQADK